LGALEQPRRNAASVELFEDVILITGGLNEENEPMEDSIWYALEGGLARPALALPIPMWSHSLVKVGTKNI